MWDGVEIGWSERERESGWWCGGGGVESASGEAGEDKEDRRIERERDNKSYVSDFEVQRNKSTDKKALREGYQYVV